MAPHKVFVIWVNPLFHKSVQMLLQHPEVDWIGSTSNFTTAKQMALDLHPDVILIEEMENDNLNELIEILKSSPCGVRVVSLNMNDNQLSVYYREERTILLADDLLKLVLGTAK